MTDHIPLNKLTLSPRNVRKTDCDEDIEGLADSIHSKGLLQNLVVSEGEQTGRSRAKLWEVDAGGRRLRALQLLARRKDLPANWPVPCIVVPRDDAREASLAENIQKIAMNPADEVEAFAAIIGADLSADEHARRGEAPIADEAERIANCARRFGRTEHYIRQRLRLAALAPDILAALREGAITIEAARAYATHPDHKLQLQIFKREQKGNPDYSHRPAEIRRALEGKVYPADHWLVSYVGLDAYRDAGGRIETDLFFGLEQDDGKREQLLDPQIVDRLAREKAAIAAQAKAQQEGWLDAELIAPGGNCWAEPKPPKGYERSARGQSAADVKKKARGESLAVFRLTEQGDVEPLERLFFRPAGAAKDGGDNPVPSRDWEAENRRDEILLAAARLAVPEFAGTPLDGRAYWPRHGYLDETDENYIVSLLITVPRADAEARLEEAERLYDGELAKEAEEQKAAEDDGNEDAPAFLEARAEDEEEAAAA